MVKVLNPFLKKKEVMVAGIRFDKDEYVKIRKHARVKYDLDFSNYVRMLIWDDMHES